MPPAPYTEKIGFHRTDRTLASVGPTRPVSGSRECAGVGLRPDARQRSDRTCRACVRSGVTYGDVAGQLMQRGPNTWLCPPTCDQTRPVAKQRLVELSGNDRTLAGLSPVVQERTCPVARQRLEELSGNDWT